MVKSTKRRQRAPQYATRAEVDEIHRTLAKRAELIADLQRTCNIQFERIAQMQVQIDHLERRLGRFGPGVPSASR